MSIQDRPMMPSEPDQGQHARAEPKAGSRLAQRIGLTSLRGRYLYIAGVIALLLLAAALVAQHFVDRSVGTSADNLTQRREITAKLHHIDDDIWGVQIHLQNFMLVPDLKKRDQLRQEVQTGRPRAAR